MRRILITGVRGKTGAPLAKSLIGDPGVEVLGSSSDPSTVTTEGVTPTAFSWDDPAGWPSALAGVDAVFLVRPDRPDAPELVERFVPATSERTHVVLLSERDVDSMEPGAWAPRAEQVVRDSDRSWTILRPSWFLQVLADPRFLRDDIARGELPFSSAGARVAWIDARDIAAVAERALIDDGHAGATYELSGPQSLTLDELAASFTEVLGHPVRAVERSIDDELDGLDGFFRDLTQLTFERVHAGRFAGVTGTVERVTGRPARSVAQFLADGEAGIGSAPAE